MGSEGEFWNHVKEVKRQERMDVGSNRMKYALAELNKLGVTILHYDETKIVIDNNFSKVTFYPFTGWFTGKSVKDGRGIKNLLKQLRGLV